MATILVVDNEERMCKLIRTALEMEQHRVLMAFSGEEALQKIDNNPIEIVITDLKMDRIGGLDVLKHAREKKTAIEVILITAFASQQTAVEAMRLGAYDYLIKPFEMEELVLRVERIMKHKMLEEENRRLRKQDGSAEFRKIIGRSAKMREVFRLIERVAGSDATVLIRGESGTGKELIAEAIHEKSERAEKRFVTINCAAVPENLLESELFGYEKGAFTGAAQRKTGLFEVADGGTIFLDEIGDMPLSLQAKLLRVLQNRQIVRVGGTEPVHVNVRVIAATHQDLEELIRQGQFRSDLFYRINIFPVNLPPLRDRKEDIPALIQYFLGEDKRHSLTPAARNLMMEYDWPGNIRELQNVLERAAIIADGAIDVQHLPDLQSQKSSVPGLFDIPDEGIDLEEVEKNLIRAALRKADGNKTRAAQLLSVTRRKLYSMMERFGIQ